MRRRMMMNTGLLPAGYRRLEYIENISNAYIDTGITGDTNSSWLWEGKIGRSRIANNRRFVAGFFDDQNPNYCEITSDKYGAIYYNIDYLCSNTYIDKNTLYDVSFAIANPTRELSLTYAGATQTATYSGNKVVRNNFCLFPPIIGISTSYIIIGENTLKKNGESVCHLIPAQRLLDNKIGMFDIVSQQFLTSPNGVNFVAPPYPTTYAQNGLIMWLDGIDNAGIGVHETNPTTWVDLTGNHTLVGLGGLGIPSFTENAAYFNSAQGLIANSPLVIAAINSNQCTIEIVMFPIERGANTNNSFIVAGQSVRGFSIWDNNNNSVSGFSYRQEGYTAVSSGRRANELFRVILQGNKVMVMYGTTKKIYNDTHIGTVADDGVIIGAYTYCYMYAVRIYNRVLTDEEIYYNALLDEKRFDIIIPE